LVNLGFFLSSNIMIHNGKGLHTNFKNVRKLKKIGISRVARPDGNANFGHSYGWAMSPDLAQPISMWDSFLHSEILRLNVYTIII